MLLLLLFVVVIYFNITLCQDMIILEKY